MGRDKEGNSHLPSSGIPNSFARNISAKTRTQKPSSELPASRLSRVPLTDPNAIPVSVDERHSQAIDTRSKDRGFEP